MDYGVILGVPPSSKANETVEIISKNLITAVQNYSDCDENCTGSDCE